MTLDTDIDDIKDIKAIVQNTTNLVKSGAADIALSQVDAALERLKAHRIAFPHRSERVDILLEAGNRARASLMALIEAQSQMNRGENENL